MKILIIKDTCWFQNTDSPGLISFRESRIESLKECCNYNQPPSTTKPWNLIFRILTQFRPNASRVTSQLKALPWTLINPNNLASTTGTSGRGERKSISCIWVLGRQITISSWLNRKSSWFISREYLSTYTASRSPKTASISKKARMSYKKIAKNHTTQHKRQNHPISTAMTFQVYRKSLGPNRSSN